MSVRLKPVREQVIVITGASSGIGLATAREAAKRGARVVLAARNGDALAAIERDIRAAGGDALAVPTDVGSREQVQHLADEAVRRYGRFDTWVNNAGVGLFGRLEEASDEDHRKIFETNFWGLVYGSLIAVGHLKVQGGGALINLGSVASELGFPMQGMYAASKHAILGFTDSLREELIAEKAPVSVTLIKPAAINTPYPQNARNYMDVEPKLPPPVYQPEDAAAAILHAAEHPVRDAYVGGGGRAMAGLESLLPGAMDWVAAKVMPAAQRRDEPPRNPAGALHTPGPGGKVHGDHPGLVRSSLYTRAARHPGLVGLLGLGAAVAAVAAIGGVTGSNGRRG